MSSERSVRPVISLTDVGKVFEPPSGGVMSRLLGRGTVTRLPVTALDSVSLTVAPGEKVGIIGHNGAGKSTLLRLIAGTTAATTGSVRVHGSVSSMIELGLGFHPDLTGRENALCSLSLAGVPYRDLAAAVESCVEFAEIGDAVDQPMKQFSTGMEARLGFAVATFRRADVLVVDEVLEVGDQNFQAKCARRIDDMVAQGTALLFVSHSMPQVINLCERVVWLDRGRVGRDGSALGVIEQFLVGGAIVPRSASPMAKARGQLAPVEIESLERATLSLDFELFEDADDAEFSVEMSLPALEPGLVTMSSATAYGPLARGRYRAKATTSPMIVEGATYRADMLIGNRGERALLGSTELRVSPGASTPNLAAHITTRVWPDTSSGPDPVDGFEAPVPIDPVIAVRGASKRYRHHGHSGADKLALDNLDFYVERGEVVGIVGANGAGKSTLLRAIARVTALDAGSVHTVGRVIPLLDLGVGAHGQLTGRENIDVIAAVLGAPASERRWLTQQAIEFSGLGAAIDRPLREYSTGMRARLGFSTAVHLNADIYLIDETLAVGDPEFRVAALAEIDRLRGNGATILFVSHEMALVEQVCSRAVWLAHGGVVKSAPVAELVDAYSGRGWGGGSHDATSAVRITEFQLQRRAVQRGGNVEFFGALAVDAPNPYARFELQYRLPRSDHTGQVTATERDAATFFRREVVPAGRELAAAGRYRFEGRVDGHAYDGAHEVVAVVVDGLTGDILGERWMSLSVGSGAAPFPAMHLGVDWTITPVSAASAGAPTPADPA